MSPTAQPPEERRDSDETIVLRRPRADDTVVMPAVAPPRPTDAGPEAEYRWWTPTPSYEPPPGPREPRRWRPYAFTAALFLVAAAIGLGGGALVATQLHGGGHTGSPGATAEAATPRHAAKPTVVPIRQIGSFDPSGGSGFEQRAGGWTTQHYTSPTFGNLKPGVGLVIDLGHPVKVGAVELDGVTPGTLMELHAGDLAPHGAAPLPAAGGPVTASGARTVLYPNGASAHRYWVVWVTRLPGGSGGYQTSISGVHVIAAKG